MKLNNIQKKILTKLDETFPKSLYLWDLLDAIKEKPTQKIFNDLADLEVAEYIECKAWLGNIFSEFLVAKENNPEFTSEYISKYGVIYDTCKDKRDLVKPVYRKK
ncbi:hypothetical protein NO1_0226 [Candidatus Termititenax aidoneus]|uniref:Uncharacterized protein n=1 Tax=Termititenax aidoneus TaxID=2218524 RepID=A0A388T8P8_TERA1|nr:hypothetical protein NO1_0226 [Candidatus Termititenax aidoneus]